MIRFAFRLLGCLLVVFVRRLRRGPARPTWTLAQETLVLAQRSGGAAALRISPQAARARFDSLVAPSAALREVTRTDVDVDGVPARWFQPRVGVADSVVLYVHGGGYVFGTLDVYADLVSRLTLAHGGRTLAIQYRRAPEHTFPAAVEDAQNAYRWLLDQGVQASRIVIAGDSAGGALALTTLLAAREAGWPQPAGALLISPWLDLTCSQPSIDANASWDWGDRHYLRHWADLYLAGHDGRDPRASPFFCDPAGLAPLSVHVGSVELIADEVAAFVDRARAEGASVELRCWTDQVHGWALMAPAFPAGHDTVAEAGAWIRQRTQPVPAVTPPASASDSRTEGPL